MNILIKFPTRSRSEQFFKTLEGYVNLSTKKNIQYLISIDQDDITMNNASVHRRLEHYDCVNYVIGYSQTKVEACNRDMYLIKEWDICLLASDDMICQCPAWDDILRGEMESNFPDTDGCLYHWDGDPNTLKHNNENGLCTMNIIGRKYYDRFGYLYHPSYRSLWCDNEYTEVAQRDGRMKFFNTVIFKHEHFSNNSNIKVDKLMERNNTYYRTDEENYKRRKLMNFPK